VSLITGRRATANGRFGSLGQTVDAANNKAIFVEIDRLGGSDFLPQGRLASRLNFGDRFAYALAKASGAPRLFKGQPFLPAAF
jgi:hypothetical protein